MDLAAFQQARNKVFPAIAVQMNFLAGKLVLGGTAISTILVLIVSIWSEDLSGLLHYTTIITSFVSLGLAIVGLCQRTKLNKGRI